MKLLNHKIFIREEFFGSIIYNTKNKDAYFFDNDSTVKIKEILSGNFKNSPTIDEFKNDLIKNGLLTSEVVYIKNKQSDGLSAPLRVFLSITDKCNLKCKHCFADSGNFNLNELTTEELFELIDQMKDAGTFFLSIAGGEPLLRDDLFQIIKYARENFIAVSISTNGLLINKEIAKKFNELNLNTISVSIDGLEITHDHIRGNGNFRKTIEKIKILRRYCKTATLAIRTTINSLNINEYKELIKLAEKLSLDSIRFNPIHLLGRANVYKYLLVDQDEYINFLKDVQEVKTKIKVELPKIDNKKYWFVYLEGFGCHGGKETCCITSSGDLSPCIFLGDNFVVGNIKNEKFLNLWVKAKNIVKLSGNKICNNCSEYKNCRGGCRARALVEYKDINAIDPFCALKKNKLNEKSPIREGFTGCL
jgi:radical SAM protein with 4Fe4S-binding SPASM domain